MCSEESLFLRIGSDVLLSIQNYSVVSGRCGRVLSITAFCLRIYLRSLIFEEILVFSSYLKVAGFFELHL